MALSLACYTLKILGLLFLYIFFDHIVVVVLLLCQRLELLQLGFIFLDDQKLILVSDQSALLYVATTWVYRHFSVFIIAWVEASLAVLHFQRLVLRHWNLRLYHLSCDTSERYIVWPVLILKDRLFLWLSIMVDRGHRLHLDTSYWLQNPLAANFVLIDLDTALKRSLRI